MVTNEPPIGAQGTLDDVNIADNEVPFFDILLSAPDANGDIAEVEQTGGSMKVAVTETTQTPLKASDQPFDVSASEVPVGLQTATAEIGVNQTEATPKYGQTSSPGTYTELDLGALRKFVDVFYSVSSEAGDIVFEVSADGTNWREHTVLVGADGDINTGGQMIQMSTAYQHVRAKATTGFADSDVQVVEIAAKGA